MSALITARAGFLTEEKPTRTEELLLQTVFRAPIINISKDIVVPSVGYDHGWASESVTWSQNIPLTSCSGPTRFLCIMTLFS